MNNPFKYCDPDGQFVFMIAIPLAYISFEAIVGAVIAATATAFVAYEVVPYVEECVNRGIFTPPFVHAFRWWGNNAFEKRHTPDQEALCDLVGGVIRPGISNSEADILLDWAEEYGYPHRDD